MSFYIWKGGDLELRVRLQPKASRDEIVGPREDELKIRITAPPLEGRANAHLIRFLAGQFGVPRRQVTLLSGEKGRSKRLRIEAPAKLPESIATPARREE